VPAAPASAPTPTSGWLRDPFWDTTLVAFSWVPVWLWAAYWLGLSSGEAPIASRPEFRTALSAVLALTFLHRQYVFLLIYGDRRNFALRPRAFVAVPCFLLVLVGGAVALRSTVPLAFQAVLVAGGIWNIWHTLMQRYGLLRIYGARAGGGLASGGQARLDLALLWASAALVAAALVLVWPVTLLDHPATRRVLELSAWLREGPLGRPLAAGIGLCWASIAALWARQTWRSGVAPGAHLPRVVLLASTFALLAVFLIHGPIVGYLAFGAAHALEYVAFVHHVGERKYATPQAAPVARLFRSPALAGGLLVLLPSLYLVLRGEGLTAVAVYLTYDSASALAHFLFDGWIWKVRRPSVSNAVVARPAG
jgi:hypothetical protein